MVHNTYKLFAVLAILFLLPIALAHEEQPKTTPDKPYYGLSVALDKLSLALTFDNHAKAKKGLAIAHERLLEIKAMREAGKLDRAEISADNYASAQEAVANSVSQIKAASAEAEAEKLADVESGLVETEEEANEVSGELAADAQTGDANSESSARIGRINERISHHQKAILKLEERKAKLTGKVSENKTREIEQKHRNLAEREAKASKAIADAESEIMLAELVAGKFPKGGEAVANAKKHLASAKAAFTAKKYGEAFGQATAALKIAAAVEKRAEQSEKHEEIKGERGNKTTGQKDVKSEKAAEKTETANANKEGQKQSENTGRSSGY